MKDIFLSITILLGMQILHAQSLPLKVDGGGDVHRCSYEESVQLGGKPTVSGGVAPYTYQWSMIPKEEYYYGLITASKLLTDTTIANPTFKGGNGSPDPITFFLKVTDAEGTECFDTVTITTSLFWMTLAGCFSCTIEKGDSVYLEGWANIGGGWGKVEYLWTPQNGLSDTNILNGFWAKPEVSTSYTLTITDEKGCRVTAQAPSYCIYVNQTGIQTISEPSVKIYPTLVKTMLNIENAIENVQIFDISGRILMSIENKETNLLQINVSHLSKGMYFIKIGNYTTKFVKE